MSNIERSSNVKQTYVILGDYRVGIGEAPHMYGAMLYFEQLVHGAPQGHYEKNHVDPDGEKVIIILKSKDSIKTLIEACQSALETFERTEGIKDDDF